MYEKQRRSGAELRLSKQRLGLVVPRAHHFFGSIFESDVLHLAELGVCLLSAADLLLVLFRILEVTSIPKERRTQLT